MEAAAASSDSCPKDDHHDDDDCVFLEPEDGEFLLPGDRIRSGADAVNTGYIKSLLSRLRDPTSSH